MKKRELLFFERDIFYEYRSQKESEGYTIISINDFLKDVSNNNTCFTEFDYTSQIIDISAFGNGYYRDAQSLGEQIIDKFIDAETIFIADKKTKEELQFELRYCFEKFNDIELIVNVKYVTNKQNRTVKSKHKKIIDLSESELETFLQKFKEKLYGHDKFKDDFTELVKNFRVFNKLGEHKILSLFLLGESGVGKTEVARILHKCLGGKKKLAKVNFGNYSSEFSLSSLIGSARGYIGSEDGEIFINVRDTDVGIILIDEFEKSNATLFNYFLDVLESGKIISSLADEIDLNGFIIVFTSNISKEDFPNRISPELRSRFDYKGKFTLLYKEDKRKFVEFRVKSIIKKYNAEFDNKIDENEFEYFLSKIDIDKFNNMRDLNKKIKKTFVDYVSTKDLIIDKTKPFCKKILQAITS